ncbi:hypothetical protein K1719_007191 [Acacia pycnantha]|nr:hypothetical protein K1719_007191 [Acacia pycnantha]
MWRKSPLPPSCSLTHTQNFLNILVADFTIRYGNLGSKLIGMCAKKQLEEIVAQLDLGDNTMYDHQWRQAIIAAGSECVAAFSAERYLVGNDLVVEFHQVFDFKRF